MCTENEVQVSHRYANVIATVATHLWYVCIEIYLLYILI